MLFNSFPFACFFLLTTACFFLFPPRLQRLVLLIASCYFYGAFIPAYLLILIALILIDYGAGLLLGREQAKTRRQILLSTSLAANLGLLFIFKYANFLSHTVSVGANLLGVTVTPPLFSMALPIGLSFHTFQSMAYVIECYRGRQAPERNLLTYALYVLFYPQLVAGPIERPQHLLPQLNRHQEFEYERVVSGLRRMLLGFFKKLVIADRAGLIVDRVYDSPTSFHGLPILLATYAFALQIYCDFSGYSDIAIGAARVLGFELTTNFKQPYFSVSLREFWQRWHISLSTWFRDYVYFPLGGNRRGNYARCRNLLLTFMVSGLWHGASWSFVLWGAWHGAFVVFETVIRPRCTLPRWLRGIVVFHVVTFGWIFFRANSVSNIVMLLNGLFRTGTFFSMPAGLMEPAQAVTFLPSLGILAQIDLWDYHGAFEKRLNEKNRLWRWALYYGLGFEILIFGVFQRTQFIYFQF